MNNNNFINILRQKNKQYKKPDIEQKNNQDLEQKKSDLEQKYNPDVNVKYNNLLSIRDKREFQHSTTVWKPIIGSIDKLDIKSNDLQIKTSKVDISTIKTAYEKELAERTLEQSTIEQRLHSNLKLEEIKIDENLIKIENNFDELKKIAINKSDIESSTILESITKLDELLNSIKNI